MIRDYPHLLKAAIILAFVGGSIFGWRAWEVHQVFDAKAIVQARETAAIYDYTKRHASLQAAQKKFEQNYPSEALFSDWTSYFAHLDLKSAGLHADIDKLTLSQPASGGVDLDEIGLKWACISTTGSTDLTVSADSYAALFAGLGKFLARPDIKAESVTLYGEKSPPEAKLGKVCLLIRRAGG